MKVIPLIFSITSGAHTVTHTLMMSRLLVYSAGCGVNRVQVVLSGFSVRFLCRYGCKCFFTTLLCVDVMVMSSA